MSDTTFRLRVSHPSIDPRKITEELGLPPTTSWQAGDGRAESRWQTRLAGAESGHGDVNAALRDIAARFEPYRFFTNEMRAGGGRIEIVVSGSGAAVDAAVADVFRDLGVVLVSPDDA